MKNENNLWPMDDLPKIGVRPIIDGRLGGVRESLEDQVMSLANAVSKLIEKNIKYPNGESVNTIIAKSCIGGVKEAAETKKYFADQNVGVSLSVTPCWAYGSETMDMDPHLPKCIWGFNGTERPGAVYLAATLAAHGQKGLPAFGIYGRDVKDAGDIEIPPDVESKLFSFIKAGLAVALMRGKSYLSVGSISMGIAGSEVDSEFFEKYLGMRVEFVDMVEILGRIEKEMFDQAEFERATKWVKKNCQEGKDYNLKEKQRERNQLDKEWETSIKMALIVKDLISGNPKLDEMGYSEQAHGHNAIVSGFQGQRQWTDHYPNGDFMEAILNSSFDWDGVRSPYIVATENDSLNGVSMLFGHLLTNTAQIFADLRTYWSPEAVERVTGEKLEGKSKGGILHLLNSGPATLDGTGQQSNDQKEPAMKPYWEITDEEIDRCLRATTWHPSVTEYFPGGGWSTRFLTKGNMPSTMHRINLIDGLSPVIQIAEGYTVGLSEHIHKILDERTNPTWPTTWFVPNLVKDSPVFDNVYSVMNAWGANHCVLTYGHIGDLLISLASLLRIPVYMHNVSQSRIFRQHSWNSFGTADSESADFRACKNYGPLYK